MKFKIRRYDRVSSTNSVLLKEAAEGAPEGLVIVTDYQTRGRGKPGRKWVSPPRKNLLFSLLLRPPITPSRAPLITQIACRSVARVLKKDYHIASTLKRPNDVMVKGKKICGVLVEASSHSNGQLESVVIGVGLNVNSRKKELVENATSMKEITQKNYGKAKLLESLLGALAEDLEPLYAYPA